MTTTKPETVINPSAAFQFIEVIDTGADSGACCPHCGAEGRYIYVWAEYGQKRSAMAGCYKALTGRIKKDDVTEHIERIAVKQAKHKPLNGWDKTILRMLEYINKNSQDAGKVSWADSKIWQAVREAKAYSFRKFVS
jgi:hypothetical protein